MSSRVFAAIAVVVSAVSFAQTAKSGLAAESAVSSNSSVRQPLGIYAVVNVEDEIKSLTKANPAITNAQLDAGFNDLYQSLLNNPAISGLTLQVHWDTVNPNPPASTNGYYWNYIDDAFNQAAAWNTNNPANPPMTIQLIVSPGFQSPKWLLDQIPSCDGLFQTLATTPSRSCGKVTFTGFSEAADGSEVPLPWNPVYKTAWSAFLTALQARYGANPLFVSIAVSGPTAASAEMIVPTDANSNNPQTQFGTPITPTQMWAQLLAFRYAGQTAYQKTNQAFIDEWNNAIDLFGSIFSSITVVATTGNGLPNFTGATVTIPPAYAADCTISPDLDCAAETTILQYLSQASVGGANAKASQNSGMEASRANTVNLGVPGVKQLSQATAQLPSPSAQILGGAQFNTTFSIDTLAEGCTSTFPPNRKATPTGCTIPSSCTTNGCIPVACIPQACLAPGVSPASLATFKTFANVPAADLISPEQALYNVLSVYFDGTPAAALFGGTPGTAPLNYLQIYSQDIQYATANAKILANVIEAGANVSVSAQSLLTLASQTLFSIAEGSAAAPLSISASAQLPAGTVGTPYSQTLAASGGSAPYNWSLASGTLPPGLTLAATGAISGTPATAGTSSFIVQVTDSNSSSATLAATMIIQPPASPLPLTNGVYLGVWADPNSAKNQEAAIEILEGPPPSGIGRTFNLHLIYLQWGAIASQLDSNGRFQPNVALAGDIAHGRVPVISWNCDSNVANSNHVIAGADAAEDAIITASAQALKQYPGPVILRWFWEFNVLANNQSCRGDTGGKPTQQVYNDFIGAWQRIQTLFQNAGATNVIFLWNPGNYNEGGNEDPHGFYPGNQYVDWIGIDAYQKTATASFDANFGQFYRDFSISQFGNKPMMVGENGAQNYSNNNTELQAPYLQGLLANIQNGKYPLLVAYDYFNAPGNPPGSWVLDDNNGQGNGGLAALAALGSSGVFAPPPAPASTSPISITTSALPSATVGTAYSVTVAASGGTPPYAWAVSVGSLPSGLALTPAGTISGTPTAAGTSNFTIQVSDSNSAAAAFSATLVVQPAGPPTTITFFVSPSGNDSWSGTLPTPTSDGTDGPFATFDAARLAVQAVDKTNLTQVAVQFRGGTYYLSSTEQFTAADSGSATTQITYQNYPGETPVFSGGMPVTNWTNVSGNKWTTTLPPSTQYFENLFYNGERRLRPRLGGASTGTLGTYFRIVGPVYLQGAAPPAPAPDPNCSVYFAGNGWECYDRFLYNPQDPIVNTWMNLSPPKGNPCNQPVGKGAPAGDIELVNFERWSVSKLRISCVDTTKKIVYLTGDTATEADHPTAHGFIPNHRYLIENVQGALTQPGQWFLDRSTTPWVLTYLASPGENPNNDTVIVPQLVQLLVASNLQYVTFQGVTFAHDGYTIPDTGYNGSSEIISAISFQNSQSITFDSNIVSQTSGAGMEFISCVDKTSKSWCLARSSSAVNKNNVIQNSAFYDIAADAIRIGVSGHASDTNDNVAQFITVQNNVVEGYGRVFASSNGIAQGQGHDNLYTHNEIYDGYHGAIHVCYCADSDTNPPFTNNNTVSFNHVYNLFQGIMNDTGSIYFEVGTPSPPSSGHGNKMLNNVVHDVSDASALDSDGYGGDGLYLDDFTGNADVENNLVYRVSGNAISFSGPRAGPNQSSTVKNNIFAFARQSMLNAYDPYSFNVVPPLPMFFTASNNLLYFDRTESQSFYLQGGCTYPGAIAYTAYQQWTSNLYWRTDRAFAADAQAFHVQQSLDAAGACGNNKLWKYYNLAGWQALGEDPQSVIKDPGFKNPAYPADDYSLPNGSPGVGFVVFDPKEAGRSNPVIMPPPVPPTFPTKPFDPAKDY